MGVPHPVSLSAKQRLKSSIAGLISVVTGGRIVAISAAVSRRNLVEPIGTLNGFAVSTAILSAAMHGPKIGVDRGTLSAPDCPVCSSWRLETIVNRLATVKPMTSLSSKLKRIKFTFSPTRAGRIHYLTAEDVRVLLSRLPEELWQRLRAVHFNDRSRGRRVAGYVNMGHREIAICALPTSVSCAPYTAREICTSPRTFGAARGKQWSNLAVRRFLLYDVFLHELGHLQVVDPDAKNMRRRFASESLANEFAKNWRRKLWQGPFDHPDPVHYAPRCENLQEATATLRSKAAALWRQLSEIRNAADPAVVADIARRLSEVETAIPLLCGLQKRLAESGEVL